MTVAPLNREPRPVTPAPSLEALRMNGMSPFWSQADCASTQLNEAHALLTVMASAFNESGTEGVNAMNHAIIAAALDGIASLVALAQHHADCTQAQRGDQ